MNFRLLATTSFLLLIFGTPSALTIATKQQERVFSMEAIVHTQQGRNTIHPGYTLVIGAPFPDSLLEQLQAVQGSISQWFQNKGLSHCLQLYHPDQLHATVIELASQHPENTGSFYLTPREWNYNAAGQPIDVQYVYKALQSLINRWDIEFELGEKALDDASTGKSLRITPTGLIVIKGRPVGDKKLLSTVRTAFHKEANITHKYGDDDDEIYIVLGQLLPRKELEDAKVQQALELFMAEMRHTLRIRAKVEKVRLIYYTRRDLHPDYRLTEQTLRLGIVTDLDRR